MIDNHGNYRGESHVWKQTTNWQMPWNQQYADDGCCPYCGSIDWERDDDFDWEHARQSCVCEVCGAEWWEVLTPTPKPLQLPEQQMLINLKRERTCLKMPVAQEDQKDVLCKQLDGSNVNKRREILSW